ncbi:MULTISPECIES: hypothetical protein [Streptomycetaceae]|uniref:Uncharacterized protein n=1 Tax=Streptantibioticus cattleyicolor (strain ATCC 35852 / DSM 46488 / JCM 4925 / NBRC 14057 / NRRL 8057) TaxID=1003195 RepID=F8K020_STREN|nr:MULTISPECIES: hypothetical protein [Streptomycetaceae]AEW94792.1 hypothetical protein SCATT_24210 [Streptantibioticus cattleyicolor NRRL 8057 = DSM 46488]MYS59418.1 hypothetical protein [Streptomyces sp. SID5468]CCB75150.1 conserved protein of unknown function [Streptantibioticus cattleyicolor NRRL 8057 = DSM 46488]
MRVGITGHRGLPEGVAKAVVVAIGDVVRGYPAADLVGVSCIADGPDAWFAQAVLERGGRVEVVVPAREYRESLPGWHHATYDALLRAASRVHETGLVASDPVAHMRGSEMLVGLVDELVAVWDGLPARGYGGTADVVAHAGRVGVPVRVVWPEGATR